MAGKKNRQGDIYSETVASEQYNLYAEGDLIADPAFWAYFEELKRCVKSLPAVLRDEILSAAGKMAAYQEERAFRAGLQLGFSLGDR